MRDLLKDKAICEAAGRYNCQKCGVKRDSFEELFAHMASCKSNQGEETKG